MFLRVLQLAVRFFARQLSSTVSGDPAPEPCALLIVLSLGIFSWRQSTGKSACRLPPNRYRPRARAQKRREAWFIEAAGKYEGAALSYP